MSAFIPQAMIASYHTIKVFCRGCQYLLLTYHKGGKGQLVKIHLHKIVEDFTQQKGICPKCGSQFGREAVIKNHPALRVIGGKLFHK